MRDYNAIKEYAGYNIVISYNIVYAGYSFIVKTIEEDEKDEKTLFGSTRLYDDIDSAYVRACTRINDEL